ncbi:Methylamine utilization protein MauE [compost metagenome]
MVYLIVLLLTVILLISGVSKLFSRERFIRTLFDIGVPRRFLVFISVLIPICELACSVLLLVPLLQTIGEWVVLLMFTGFSIGITGAIRRKAKTDCNCFGNFLPEKLGWSTLVRLMVFIILTAVSILLPKADLSTLSYEDLFNSIASSLGIFSIYIIINIIQSNIKVHRVEV